MFWLRQDNAIVLAPATLGGATTTPEGEAIVRSANASSVETWGTEGYFELDATDRVALFSRWLAMLGTQENAGDPSVPASTPADRIPPMQATLGARYAATKALALEVYANGRKRQQRLNDPTNLDDNRIPNGGTPGFLTYHVHGTYHLDRHHHVRLNLDNVTDELVLEHGSGFYAPGFSASISFDGRFGGP
jgi:hypothetical protein